MKGRRQSCNTLDHIVFPGEMYNLVKVLRHVL